MWELTLTYLIAMWSNQHRLRKWLRTLFLLSTNVSCIYRKEFIAYFQVSFILHFLTQACLIPLAIDPSTKAVTPCFKSLQTILSLLQCPFFICGYTRSITRTQRQRLHKRFDWPISLTYALIKLRVLIDSEGFPGLLFFIRLVQTATVTLQSFRTFLSGGPEFWRFNLGKWQNLCCPCFWFVLHKNVGIDVALKIRICRCQKRWSLSGQDSTGKVLRPMRRFLEITEGDHGWRLEF